MIHSGDNVHFRLPHDVREKKKKEKEEAVEFDDYSLLRKLLDQDITYAAVWDKNIYESFIEKIFKEIRFYNYSNKPYNIQKKKELISKYERIVKRNFFDQTIRDESGRILEPQQLQKKKDIITTQGLARLSEIFAGEKTANYLWMIEGKSNISAELGDWRLYDEFSVASILLSGYASGSATIIKHGAQFSINDPTEDTLYEFAVRDFPTYNDLQTVWFRSVLDHPISHTQGRDVIVVAHAAYLVSVADFEEQIAENNI